ncbi:MAG: hypothetical protein WCR72_02480 [Bacteroidota bacterium]
MATVGMNFRYAFSSIIAEFISSDHLNRNVLKIEKDTLADIHCRFWQVYIADSVGIIQYSERGKRKTWQKVE